MFKKFFLKIISFGVYPEMDESKKTAIQVASFDGLASLFVILFYFLYSVYFNLHPLTYFHFTATVLSCLGLYLLKKRHYDAGRILLHFVGLSEIFLTVDGMGVNSGYEHYYFTTISVPFITFTSDEIKKSVLLSMAACSLLITQLILGAGLFVPVITPPSGDRLLAIIIVLGYVLSLFSISRWQMKEAQKKIKLHQGELIHASNIAALGEMSGGVAHEINNPLQILSAHIESLKRQMKTIEQIPPKMLEQLSTMERTVDRMAKLVKGLKSLSRNSVNDPYTTFPIGEVIDDVMIVCAQRLKDYGIDLKITGEKELKVKGHVVQLSQVFINLLNNAVDALQNKNEKWIYIHIEQKEKTISVSVTDAGDGIPEEIVRKIMHPFFTTKAPGQGTGLGLSISNSIVEKIGGKFFYNPHSPKTQFVIELPLVK